MAKSDSEFGCLVRPGIRLPCHEPVQQTRQSLGKTVITQVMTDNTEGVPPLGRHADNSPGPDPDKSSRTVNSPNPGISLDEAGNKMTDTRVEHVAMIILILASLVLLGTAVYMFTIHYYYEVSAALSSIVIFWLIRLLTRRMFSGRLQPVLQSFLVLSLLEAIYLGTILNLYDTLPYFDKFNHTLFGAVLAMVGTIVFFWLNPEQRAQLTVRPGFVALFNVGFALTGKILWEFYEYAGDRVLHANMQQWQQGGLHGLIDTMLDLTAGMIGALIISLIIRHQLLRNPARFYQHFISSLFAKSKDKKT